MNNRVAIKIGVAGAALGLVIGAASAASAASAGTSAAVHGLAVSTAAATTTAPAVTTAGAAALAARLPKGASVKIVSAQTVNALLAANTARSASAIRPAISEEGCSGQWGVQVDFADDTCAAFGYAGTATFSPAAQVDYVFTDNNSGSLQFDKDHSQYPPFQYGSCYFFNFETGTTTTGALQAINITSYQDGVTCSSEYEITF